MKFELCFERLQLSAARCNKIVDAACSKKVNAACLTYLARVFIGSSTHV